jgi:amino acid adenylation domain-containing protein
LSTSYHFIKPLEESLVYSAAVVPDRTEVGMADLVASWVRLQPESLAVREPLTGAVLTYRELWEKSGWLASELAEMGIRKGHFVAIDLPRSADLVVAFLGVVRAGAAYLPLDTFAPTDRVAGILQESGVEVVVCGRPGSRRQSSAVRWLPVSHRPSSGPVPAETAAGKDAIYVIYTSGSTGRPKGVVIPHCGVVRLVTSPNFYLIEPGDRVANTCNPAFDGTTWEIWSALASGATVVPFPRLTSLGMDDWLALLRNEGITSMLLTTSLFHTIAWERPEAFGTLRDLLVGGEQLDLFAARRVLAARPPLRLVNCYGPTEGSSIATYFECTEQSLADVDRVPIGYALQQTSLFVLDDELRAVPAGEVGELCLGGPGVATGYLGRPELTAERFVIEPTSGMRVYRTGDLVKELPTLALEMVGRRDRQVKLRGFRIELAEIERVAAATGLIDAVFVEKVGEGVTAVLVGFALPARCGDTMDIGKLPDLLSARLAERLPAYMVPSQWIVLSELPLGPTGKADRAAMLTLLASQEPEARQAARSDSAEPVVSAVRTILLETLGVSDLPASANFVELGGNSILAVSVAVRIQEQLALPLEPADVLTAGSMAELIERLHGMEPQMS